MVNKQRNLIDYAIIYAKGLAMGAADVVPGVSGGTIALIAGIYEELIASIAAIRPNLWRIWREQGLAQVWKTVNGNFLLALLAGIASAVFLLAGAVKYLLVAQPILIWSFFFGLVAASLWFLYCSVGKWQVKTYLAAVLGIFSALIITHLPVINQTQISLFYIFFCAMIAICAMILPGISGSFILVLLGAYEFVISAVYDMNFIVIAVFMLGAIIGLLSFAQLLKYLFKHYHEITLAVLTGFVAGSLLKIQPFTLAFENFEIKKLFYSIFFIILGAALVLFVEKIGKNFS